MVFYISFKLFCVFCISLSVFVDILSLLSCLACLYSCFVSLYSNFACGGHFSCLCCFVFVLRTGVTGVFV